MRRRASASASSFFSSSPSACDDGEKEEREEAGDVGKEAAPPTLLAAAAKADAAESTAAVALKPLKAEDSLSGDRGEVRKEAVEVAAVGARELLLRLLPLLLLLCARFSCASLSA